MIPRVFMIHPIPSGTRDVLPEETREVRAITDTLRGVFERHQYGEVYTEGQGLALSPYTLLQIPPSALK